MIDDWYKSTPASQIIPIDWKKAKQGTVNGKHFITAPVLKIDLLKGLITNQKRLKTSVLSSASPLKSSPDKISVGMTILNNYVNANSKSIESKALASYVTELVHLNRDFIPSVAFEFAELQKDNLLILMPDAPCNTVQEWLALAKFKPDQATTDKMTQLANSYNQYTGSALGSYKTYIQMVEKATGSLVSMDFYPITINQLSNVNGHQYTADEFLHYLRANLNNLTDGTKTFEGYHWYGIDDREKWAFNNPKGAILALDLVGPNDASVITSRSSSIGWTFTTIHEPFYGNHPVSGHRDFGYIANQNGSYTFYTRGVDRLTTTFEQNAESLSSLLNNSGNGIAFGQGEKLWRSLQSGVAKFVNDNNGQATSIEPALHKPNWSLVKDVLKGNAPLSSLSINCP